MRRTKRVLAVIDMQVTYVAAQDPALIERIEKAARSIVRGGGRCVHVWYENAGRVTVKLPDGSAEIPKSEDDGGTVLYAWLVGAKLISPDLRVILAGVNLSACVFKTATGLGQRLHEEHAMCDHVSIDPSLCGDGGRFRIRMGVSGDSRKKAR